MIAALKLHRAALLLVMGLAAFAYAGSLSNGFVWDDTALVLRDPLIRSWRLIPEGFRHFLFIDATGSNFYRPLQRLTYVADYALYGFEPWGYHLTNILLHAGAAGALFALVRRLMRETSPERNATATALIVSSIWALHPIHSSAVVYVAGRADPLAALCGFAALNLILRDRWIYAAPLLLGALLAKESGLVALVLGIGFAFAKNRRHAARLVLPLGVTVLVLASYAALRLSADKIEPPVFTSPPPPIARPILAARAFAEYVGLLIAPVNLHMERDVSTPTGGDWQVVLPQARMREYQTLAGVVLIIGFALWLRWTRGREPLACTALVAFVISYLPISNALPLNATVAEHWLYIPSAFLLLAAALSMTHLPLTGRLWKVAGIAWVVLLAARTVQRIGDWRDQRTFLESTAMSGGGTTRMEINLGSLALSEGRLRIALAHFQNALAREPTQPFAILGLAATLTRLGEYAEARDWLAKIETVPVVRAEVLQTLAAVEYREARRDRVDLLREAARVEPRYWPAEKRYVAHLAERGDLLEAVRELRAYIDVQPFRAESWKLLALLLEQAGQPVLARAAANRATELDVRMQ
jgi:Flp pilus assembly protein TadD